jgi:hypothetical protein
MPFAYSLNPLDYLLGQGAFGSAVIVCLAILVIVMLAKYTSTRSRGILGPLLGGAAAAGLAATRWTGSKIWNGLKRTGDAMKEGFVKLKDLAAEHLKLSRLASNLMNKEADDSALVLQEDQALIDKLTKIRDYFLAADQLAQRPLSRKKT